MTPDFDDLIGSEGTPEELAELRRMHELLASADPPPALTQPIARVPRVRRHHGRAWAGAAVGLAAAFAAAFGVASGFVFEPGGEFHTGFARPMHGVGTARAARALIQVGREDGNGNRPLEFTVKSLPALSRDGWYELYLTDHGKLAVPCGVFHTGRLGTAHVRMNAPSDLEEYDGWVVTAAGETGPSGVLLST